MIKVLKNHRVTHEENNYIFFNTELEQCVGINTTPEKAKKLADMFDAQAISPMDAREMIGTYTIVRKEKFSWPLPFEV